jgi:hypothetical protein
VGVGACRFLERMVRCKRQLHLIFQEQKLRGINSSPGNSERPSGDLERISRFFWRLSMNDLCQRYCILLYCTSGSGGQGIPHHLYIVQPLTNPSSFYKSKTFKFSVEQILLIISHFKADHKNCQTHVTCWLA